MFSVRKPRPSAKVSAMKSIDQRSVRRGGQRRPLSARQPLAPPSTHS
jgi:hypothetical protein